jgi:hypothetical protein
LRISGWFEPSRVIQDTPGLAIGTPILAVVVSMDNIIILVVLVLLLHYDLPRVMPALEVSTSSTSRASVV